MKKLSMLITAAATLLMIAAFAQICCAVEVRGKVLDPDNKPVANARVAIYQYITNIFFIKRNYAVLTTDAGGRFKADLWFVKDRDPHQWIASAYKPGFAIGAMWLYEGANELKLGESGQVSGYVFDDQGKGVKDAIIRLRDVTAGSGIGLKWSAGSVLFDPFPKQFITKTDANGRWTLRDLPQVGAGRAELIDPRFVKQDWIGFQTGDASATRSFLAIARPAASIKGTVLYNNGKPAAGVKVFAGSNNGISEPVVTDKAGNYTLSGLSAYDYWVMVEDPAGLWVGSAVYCRTSEGQTEKNCRIHLTKGAIIKGRVTDAETGKPIRGAKVGCWGPSRPLCAQVEVGAFTDYDGIYRLRVSPGENLVYVTGPVSGYIDKYENATPKPGQVLKVNFNMDKGLSVSGTTVDVDGKPLAGAGVSVYIGDLPNSNGPVEVTDWRDLPRLEIGRWNTAISGPDGKFTVSLLRAGKATVRASNISVPPVMAVVEPVPVVLPSAEPVKLIMREMRVMKLTGRVIDTNGKPVSPVSVRLGAGEVTTNAAGEYVFDNIVYEDQIKFNSFTRPGYRLVSGGEVTKIDGNYSVSDIILAPETD